MHSDALKHCSDLSSYSALFLKGLAVSRNFLLLSLTLPIKVFLEASELPFPLTSSATHASWLMTFPLNKYINK